MKTILLLLFISQQLYFIFCLKCFSCSGDCSSPKEEECKGTCCYSSEGPLNGGGNTTYRRIKREFQDGTEPPVNLGLDEELRGMHPTFLADEPKHKYKGCCDDATKGKCKDTCYTCEADLCNKGDSGAMISHLISKPLVVLLGAVAILAAKII